MQNCKSCKYKIICPQFIAWTNEYGMITKKELKYCSQYDKDMSCKYDLSELYKKIFKFDIVQKIIREEYVGNMQMCAETKLIIVCKNDLSRTEYSDLKDIVWNYREDNSLELTYQVLEEQQFAEEYYINRNFIEFIEKESFDDKEN